MALGYLAESALGRGFIAHVDPWGTVPWETRMALKYSRLPDCPPQRRLAIPSKPRGVFWNSCSVRGPFAGAMRHW